MPSEPSGFDAAELLTALLDRARRAGADGADAMVHRAVSASVSVRLGEVEEVERAEARDLGLRVFVGQRQASVSTTDLRPDGLDALVERAVAMARLAPEDPWCGLAPAEMITRGPFAALDLADAVEPSSEDLKRWALECEAAARAVAGVTNSGGAGASYGSGESFLATSSGFFGARQGSQHGLGVSVVAGTGADMQRDYDQTSATHYADLRQPADVGAEAGRRAVARLHPRKAESGRAEIMFERRLAASLIGPLAGAINGASIARGTSFLKDKMGAEIFAPGITVRDDPFLPRAFGSMPFDGEGLAPAALDVIANGVLTTWLLNLAQARQLSLTPNARARRGTGGPPSAGPTNFDLLPGTRTPADMLRAMGEGLLVTDMFGPQINGNTGDYSVGCAGFWVRAGAIAEPVAEITIAGNLLEMWAALEPSTDFERRGSMNAPSVRVGMMTVAGA